METTFSDAANQFLTDTPHDQLFNTTFQLENNHVSDSPHFCFYFLTVISTTTSSTPFFLGKYKLTDSPHRELHLSLRNVTLRNNVLTSCMSHCPALWRPVPSFGAPLAPPCPRRVAPLWRPIGARWRSVTPCGGHRPRNNLTVRMGRQRASKKNILTNKNPTTTHIASTTQTPPTTNNQLSAAHKQQQHTATTTNNRHAQQHTQQERNKPTRNGKRTTTNTYNATQQQHNKPNTQRNATTTEPSCGLFAALRGASGTFKSLRPPATPSVSSSAFVAFVGGVLGHFSCGAHK